METDATSTDFSISPASAGDDAAKQRTAKNSSYLKRRRNRIIGNVMMYSGIGILLVLCIAMGMVLFIGQNNKGITSISFGTDEITMKAGYTQKLNVVTKPEGIEYALRFSSSDETVAAVSPSGTVAALTPGTAYITVESSGLSATCRITVKADIITSLSLDTQSLTLKGGEESQLLVAVLPENAMDKNIIWESSDSNIATVDENGKVKGIGTGEADITVKDTVTGLSASVTVSVTGLELPDSMTFAEEQVTLEVGEVYRAELVFSPADITNKSAIFYTEDSDIASVTNSGVITAKGAGTCRIEAYYENDYTMVAVMEVTVIDPFVITAKPETDVAPEPEPPTGTGTEVIDGITYVNGILVANKTYSLPSTYDPGENTQATNALYEMQSAAAAEGIVLYMLSGYRSYDTQYSIYNRYVADDGKENADRYSARPGHSEHQTGLAFDLNSFEESFGETAEGIWLAENCHKYGFIIRYPRGKEHITGYMYEPWHVRYLGTENAQKVFESGLTLEEYLGITSQYQD